MKALIVGAGAPPTKEQLQFLFNEGYTCVIAADAGAENALNLGLLPSAVIGDFDSIPPETLAHFRKQAHCEVIHLERQTDSDIEKCLTFLEEKGCDACVLCGVTGDRFDHSLSNLALLLRWSSKMHLALIAGQSAAEVIRGDVRFSVTPRAVISLFGFSPDVSVQSEGLMYPLHDETLVFGEREGLSNMALGDSARLTVRGGGLCVVRDFRELARHGFIPRGECRGDASQPELFD
jgi:thiamine pyrophosphokinase